jgi:hypothetical protein
MGTYTFYPPDYDPIEIFTRTHGFPPPGMPRRMSYFERLQAEREAQERERAEHEANDPPQPVPATAGRAGDRPQDGGGDSPASATPADEAESASPGRESPPSAAAPLPPPRAGEESDAGPKPDPASCLGEWLAHNRETLRALEAAGKLPVLAPPQEGEDNAEAAAPAPPPPPPPVHVRRGDRWNKPKMVDFLRQLAATHSVSAAARSVGMSRESAYRLRNRLKGQPFDIAWETAFRQGYDNLAHAALDRAINGVEVPHYCNGELVGTSRKYDERLTVAMLAMRNRYGAPLMGRYGAAAEWWSERWDALLERVGTGSVDWRDEEAAAGPLLDGEKHVRALIDKHAPDEGPAAERRP